MYDIILWDTGDISLRMLSIPTTNNTGTYTLTASSTYYYTVSTSSLDVTFKKTDSGFEVQNSVIELALPYSDRYLIRDGDAIYTVVDDALSSLGSVELTSTLFLDSGFDPIDGMFDLFLMNDLSSPELLYWTDREDNVSTLNIQGTPVLPQRVAYETQTINNIGIKCMEAFATDDVLIAIRMNDQMYAYLDATGEWCLETGATQNRMGMSPSVLKSITSSKWEDLIYGTTTSSLARTPEVIGGDETFTVRCLLPSTTSSVDKVAVGYDNHKK